MKKIIIIFALIASAYSANAGNKDRIGQAGASELLINPWARSSGWGGINQAMVKGFESARVNVAGLAFVNKLEVGFAHCRYFTGTNTSLNTIGAGFGLGEGKGALGIDLMSINFGEIPIKLTSSPDDNNGTFKPQFITIGISYAKTFSNSIHGGISIRGITERISNVGATGVAFDAGIQYVTGPKDNLHFGITLKNVGTPMKFSGDGLANRAPNQQNTYSIQVSNLVQKFELPSVLNIGLGYDLLLDKSSRKQRISFAGNYTSNSYTKDQIGLGVEYALREMFMLRLGLNYEPGIFSSNDVANVNNGLSGGVTFDLPLKKDGNKVGIDYSYRATNILGGSHTLGLRITL
jgi:hypothetical protein